MRARTSVVDNKEKEEKKKKKKKKVKRSRNAFFRGKIVDYQYKSKYTDLLYPETIIKNAPV